jgi:uncharacterized membrane protein
MAGTREVPLPPPEPDADASDAEWQAYTQASLEHERRYRNTGRMLSIWLVVAGLIGLYAACTLTLDKISYWQQSAQGQTPTLSCAVNAVVNCGHVINTPQASIFGSFPNPLIGIFAWPFVVGFGVLLLSGLRPREWHWLGLQLGATAAIVMVTWLQFETTYRINALCPWCMVTWVVTIATFWAVTGRNLRVHAYGNPLARLVYDVVPVWIVLHYAILFTLIQIHFGSRLWS